MFILRTSFKHLLLKEGVSNNVPVVYMAQDIIILMRAPPLQGSLSPSAHKTGTLVIFSGGHKSITLLVKR